MYTMNSIITNLFIGSLETALSEAALVEAKITHIVSLGCNLNSHQPHIHHLSFSSILDSPESIIIDVILQTNQFIATALCSGGSVLVHCVYGQSRSVTVVVAYLMSSGLSLEDSIALVKIRNPTTCINPGFLAQLQFISLCKDDSVAWQHLRLQLFSCVTIGTKRKDADICTSTEPPANNYVLFPDRPIQSLPTSMITCKSCRCDLGASQNILGASLDVAPFVRREEDGFWKGYKTSRPKYLEPPIKLPAKGIVAVYPFEWMMAQRMAATQSSSLKHSEQHSSDYFAQKQVISRIDETKDEKVNKKKEPVSKETDRCDFTCPGCFSVVGFWRAAHLNLLGEYNLCDLYALTESAVRVKKIRNVPNL